ncbi:MAG: hypothetical protein M0Z28_02580 [Rhodospirillales bacterium]|nr:hypothetical protein [Rhodospirillales bacterium]
MSYLRVGMMAWQIGRGEGVAARAARSRLVWPPPCPVRRPA